MQHQTNFTQSLQDKNNGVQHHPVTSLPMIWSATFGRNGDDGFSTIYSQSTRSYQESNAITPVTYSTAVQNSSFNQVLNSTSLQHQSSNSDWKSTIETMKIERKRALNRNRQRRWRQLQKQRAEVNNQLQHQQQPSTSDCNSTTIETLKIERKRELARNRKRRWRQAQKQRDEVNKQLQHQQQPSRNRNVEDRCRQRQA